MPYTHRYNYCNQYDTFISLIKKDYPYHLREEYFNSCFKDLFNDVYEDTLKQHSRIKLSYYSLNGEGFINFAYLDHYIIICYRVAHVLYLMKDKQELADAIYYSCRIRTGTDIYYPCVIGDYFVPIHPIGSLMDSHSTYGLGLRLYNGVHVGPYGIDAKPPSEWIHPIIGNGVTICANSVIYGETIIGNNVTISPGSIIINEIIPDNCVVFGASPNLKAIPNKYNNLAFIDN
jgi:serine O-acetyltransferase